MRTITAVVNQKGGVGKTTTSINLACALATKGKSCLLVDLDPQAHCTIGLGIELESGKSLNEVLLKKKNIRDVIVNTKITNLSLAPSHIRLDRTEQLLASELFREAVLHKTLEELSYDFIIIDCRPTLGTLTINALYACNFIIAPCDMGRYALDGFSDLMETIDTVKGNHKDKKDFVRLLLTKFDSRNRISNDWVLRQLEPYKDLLFETRIRKNEALNQAHMAQEPIFLFKPDSPGAQDYDNLAKEFLTLCQP